MVYKYRQNLYLLFNNVNEMDIFFVIINGCSRVSNYSAEVKANFNRKSALKMLIFTASGLQKPTIISPNAPSRNGYERRAIC